MSEAFNKIAAGLQDAITIADIHAKQLARPSLNGDQHSVDAVVLVGRSLRDLYEGNPVALRGDGGSNG